MKLLLIAYHFPPDAEIGSVRPYQLARHLPKLGIDCTVLTVRPEHAESYDSHYAVQDCPGVSVVRTRVLKTVRDRVLELWRGSLGNGSATTGSALDAPHTVAASRSAGRGSVRQSALEWLAFPDIRYGWRKPALAAAERLLSSEPFDVILSTSPPRVAHMVAAELHSRHGTPWIMDLRDPWFSTWNSPWRERSLQSRLQRRLFQRYAAAATLIVANTERLCAEVARTTRTSGGVVAIPNGLDPSTATGVDTPPPRQFTLAHFGQFPGRRSERPFIEGLHRWLKDHPTAAVQTMVRFVGGGSNEGVRLSESLGLTSRVLYERRVSRQGMPARLAEQYVLLLLANDQPLQVPGKAYEYLASGRRILAIAEHQSATADVLTGLPGCAIAQTPEEVALCLERFWAEYVSGAPAAVPREDVLRRMRYEARAVEYSRVLQEAAMRSSGASP
jgi:hypothetical protein